MSAGRRDPVCLSDLRSRPDFRAAVADRIWRAWWQPRGYPLGLIEERVGESLDAQPIPFALVAHAGDRFLGTVSVIASDLFARPQLSPWLAALWVDPGYRRRGVGADLVARAAQDAVSLGVERLYLCATETRRGFYESRGWTRIEERVGDDGLSVLARDAAATVRPAGDRSPPAP